MVKVTICPKACAAGYIPEGVAGEFEALAEDFGKQGAVICNFNDRFIMGEADE